MVARSDHPASSTQFAESTAHAVSSKTTGDWMALFIYPTKLRSDVGPHCTSPTSGSARCQALQRPPGSIGERDEPAGPGDLPWVRMAAGSAPAMTARDVAPPFGEWRLNTMQPGMVPPFHEGRTPSACSAGRLLGRVGVLRASSDRRMATGWSAHAGAGGTGTRRPHCAITRPHACTERIGGGGG